MYYDQNLRLNKCGIIVTHQLAVGGIKGWSCRMQLIMGSASLMPRPCPHWPLPNYRELEVGWRGCGTF